MPSQRGDIEDDQLTYSKGVNAFTSSTYLATLLAEAQKNTGSAKHVTAILILPSP